MYVITTGALLASTLGANVLLISDSVAGEVIIDFLSALEKCSSCVVGSSLCVDE